jgi:endogenous inhibitor of DNA gyrase (YacG/DUF329 family)
MIEDALIGSIKVIGLCPNCGKAIPARKGQGRQRVFCSERCRSKYARQHPSRTSQEKVREHRCEYCGGVFMVYQKTSTPRRFCSVPCARRYTIMKRRTEHGETLENQETDARQD